MNVNARKEGPMFTNADKRDCARREVVQRRRVYRRFVDTGRMTQREADRQIALMEEIAGDYARLAEGEMVL
jgi:hypothetical protein